MIIHIVGAPATGKSYLRRRLAERLELEDWSIEEVRIQRGWNDEAWCLLWSWARGNLAASRDCILETSGSTDYERRHPLLNRVIVLCVASRLERERRLRSRCNPEPRYVERLLRQGPPLLRPWRTLSSDGGFRQSELDELETALRGKLGSVR